MDISDATIKLRGQNAEASTPFSAVAVEQNGENGSNSCKKFYIRPDVSTLRNGTYKVQVSVNKFSVNSRSSSFVDNASSFTSLIPTSPRRVTFVVTTGASPSYQEGYKLSSSTVTVNPLQTNGGIIELIKFRPSGIKTDRRSRCRVPDGNRERKPVIRILRAGTSLR